MTRFIRLAAIALLALSSFSLSAHATTYSYTFFGDSPELTGNLIFNTSGAGGYTGGSFSIFDGASTYTFHPATDFTLIGSAIPFGYFGYIDFTNAAGDQFDLLEPFTIGPATSVLLCSLANPCPLAYPTPQNVYSTLIPHGTGTPFFISQGEIEITLTPEPSSFALLVTGTLGTAGMVRRRLRRS